MALRLWEFRVVLGLIHLACLEDNTSASGTQSHKPGVTGHLGMGCSSLKGFSSSYGGGRHIYVLLLSFWYTDSLKKSVTVILSNLQSSVSFCICKTKLERPTEASSIFKTLRIGGRKYWQINKLLFFNSEGAIEGSGKTSFCPGGLEELGFLNQ